MTISELSNLFNQAKTTQPWARDMSFEDFAAEGARATGDQELFRISQAGPIENTMRGWNQGLTEFVNKTPADEFLGRQSQKLGNLFGLNPETSYNVGRSLPRQVVNLAPMLVPGPGWLTTAGMIAGGGLSAADTYDQTGSGWQAGISAVAPYAVSKAAHAGGTAVLNSAAKSPMFQRLGVTGATDLPGKFVEQTVGGQVAKQGHKVIDTVVEGFRNKAVRMAGAQAAGQAAGLGLDVAAQGPEAVFNKDYLFANVVGNLAFAPLDIGDFIGTKVIASRDVFPDAPPADRTPAEERSFNFEKLIAELDPVEQAKAKKGAGLDVANQLIHERRLAGLEDFFDKERTDARAAFEAEWNAMAVANQYLPSLQTALTTPKSVQFDTHPEAFTKLEDYKAKVDSINGKEKAAWSQAMMKPNLESLQRVAMDELRLPETLLQKPVAERTLKDYQDALSDKVRDRGIKALYALHKMSGGHDVELQAKGVAEEVRKLLAEEPTKFAEDRSFVAMALWATGKKPRSEKVVEAKVKKDVNEGSTVKSALNKQNKKDVNKLTKPRKKRGADIKPRKQDADVTAAVNRVTDAIQQAGLAKDAGKATPEQKFLLEAFQAANRATDGSDAQRRAAYSWLAEVMDSGKSLSEKLGSFKKGLTRLVANFKNASAKKFTSIDASQVDSDKVSMASSLFDGEDVNVRFDEDGNPIVSDEDTQDSFDEELVVEDLIDEIDVVEAETDAPVPTPVASEDAVKAVALQLIEQRAGVSAIEAIKVFDGMPPATKKTLMQAAELTMAKFAKSNADPSVPQYGLQSLMTFDKWTDVLLADQGFDAREVTQLKEHFAKVVEIFYSPEVKYGFLDEFPLESKLAKGYVGVVGENGVRWRYGELNQMVHDDTPDTRPRLGETKFRYRDDTQTLYKWGHITDVEMENIRAKLEKLGKQVKFVKVITQGNIAEAHGITTFFGPEPGQKMKWARASAGGGFDFALGEVQGGKLLRPGKGAVTLAKDGTLSVQELKVAGGQFGPLQDGEVSFYKELVPEAFVYTDKQRQEAVLRSQIAGEFSSPEGRARYNANLDGWLRNKGVEPERVNVKMLWEKLNTLGEQVKVVTYGQDGAPPTEAKQALDGLKHEWLDNLNGLSRANISYAVDARTSFADWKANMLRVAPLEPQIRKFTEKPENFTQAEKFFALAEQVNKEPKDTSPRATSYYNQISPFAKRIWTDPQGRKWNTAPTRIDIILPGAKKWRPDGVHEQLDDTVVWAMVQIVPHPVTGEAVMVIVEAQGQWPQSKREQDAIRKTLKLSESQGFDKTDWEFVDGNGNRRLVQAKSETEAWEKALRQMGGREVPNHPLLPIHQNLILKAVIKEAQKQGISKVAVSDGETAMMTEGHDKHAAADGAWVVRWNGQQQRFSSKEAADRIAATLKLKGLNPEVSENRPSQEGGMRLAYDTTMPSIMKKLVGEGVVEDFGVHKNASAIQDENTNEYINTLRNNLDDGEITQLEHDQALNEYRQEKLVGSPVFRNPDGTPKTNVTARVYDITNPSERVNTLFARKPIPGGQVYAAAVESRRQIFLNPKALAGLSPLDRVRVQASLLAHENSHILIDKARNGLFGPEAKAIITDMDLWASSANPHEIEVVVDTLADVFLDKHTRDLPGVADVIKNLRDNSGKMDKDEVLANIYGIWATGLHQLKDPGRFYTFMPKVVRDVYDWIAGKIQGVVRAAQMYVRFGGDQEKLKRVQQVRDVFAAVRKGARQAEENLGELNQLANLSQTDVFDLADARFAQGVYGSTGKTGASFMNKIDSWVVRMGSLAATHQGLEKPFRAMVDTMPLIHDIIAQSYAGLGWGDYSYTGLNVKKNSGPARIRDSESLNNTLNKVNVEVQRLMETAVVKNPDGTVEFDLQKLSPELRAEVKQYNPEAQRVLAEYVIKRSEQTMPIVHGTIVAKEWDKQTDNLHKILFRYESMKMDYKLAEQVAYESMQAVRQGDMVKLAEVLKKVPSPVEAAQIGKFVTAMGQRIKNLEADYKKNPAFGSLRRFQPIKQTWTKTGFPDYKMQARNAKDAEAQSARLESEGWTPGIPRIEDFKPTDEWVMDSNSKKRLIDMETRLHESLDELGIPEDVKAELKKDMNFVAMLEEDAAGQSVYSTKVRREFAEGTDRLNALEQDLTFIHAAISGSMKRALDAKVSVAMLNPELNTVKDAKDVFQQGYENFNQSNNPWLSKLSKANAAWFIGMNIPGHVAELLQPMMTHLAEMRNIGLRTGKALGVIMSSNKDITAFYKRNAKKFATGETVHLWDDWKDVEEREMLFEHKHVINANPLNYAFDEMGFQQQQLIAMTDGGKKKSLAEMALSPATAYANWSLKFYNLFTRHNAIMGLVGGYRAYRQAGFSHAEAKEKVRLYEVVVNKSGGRADRQAAPFKGNAVLGHLFYGLQGYTTGWFSQALTYARHGYNSKDYIGFKDNPVAAKNARSALHTMLGAQLAASGLIGLPFVGALMTLWEEMMGEDVRGKLYENLEEVTGDPLLAQAASHGVASALAEKLGIPADLHGRFAIGGFLGFNAYDGFSAASLLGPTAGMINGMWKMGESLTQEHDVRKALASGGPTGIRNIAKALDQELPASGDSQLGTAFGFRSTQARKEIEFERIAKMRNEKAAREISHAARRVQENLGRGSAVVQQIVMAEAKKLVETESPQELKQVVSKIGSKVRQYEEEKRFPQDLREVGSTGQSAQLGNLARSMGVQLPQSQEVAREVMKSQLYQMMGMPYRSRVKDALQRDLATEREPWQMR